MEPRLPLEVGGWLSSHSEAIFAFLAGLLIKVFLDSWRENRLAETKSHLNIVESRVKSEDEKVDKAKSQYYTPLHRAISAFVNRMNIALNDLGDNYGYSREYVIATFWYEFCSICYWLDRPLSDSSLIDRALSPHHESTLRDALTTITSVPSYSQKVIAVRMAAGVDGKVKTIEEFAEQYTAIMDVELINGGNPIDLYHPIRKNLVDRLYDFRNDKVDETRQALGGITWMMLKTYERAHGAERLKLDEAMLDTADRSLKLADIRAGLSRTSEQGA